MVMVSTEDSEYTLKTCWFILRNKHRLPSASSSLTQVPYFRACHLFHAMLYMRTASSLKVRTARYPGVNKRVCPHWRWIVPESLPCLTRRGPIQGTPVIVNSGCVMLVFCGVWVRTPCPVWLLRPFRHLTLHCLAKMIFTASSHHLNIPGC